MQRQRLNAFPPIILAIALGFAAAACGSMPQMPQVDHSLTYSLVPYKGGLTATVSDGRIGKHTVWIVLLNPPRGVDPGFLGAESDGSGTGGMGSGKHSRTSPSRYVPVRRLQRRWQRLQRPGAVLDAEAPRWPRPGDGALIAAGQPEGRVQSPWARPPKAHDGRARQPASTVPSGPTGF